MKLLRSLLGCLFFSLVISVGFREVDFISTSYASGFTVAKKNALLRSVKIDTLNATWSGLIYSKNSNGFLVLTIIHEESMIEIKNSKFPYVLVSLESGEKYLAEVIAWDSCNEIAMLKLSDNDKRYIPKIKINHNDLDYGEALFSFGHPLGENPVHYTDGVVSSEHTIIKDCGARANGFSGGVSPGQTGSGVYVNDGKLTGLIIATLAYQLYSQNQSGEIISVGSMPIDGLGLYIPADSIENFLVRNNLL